MVVHEAALDSICRLVEALEQDTSFIPPEFYQYDTDCVIEVASELYSRGIFEIDHKPYRRSTVVFPRSQIQLCSHYKTVLNRLEKMGRCWHDQQEFEDFMMMLEWYDAGETVLIDLS